MKLALCGMIAICKRRCLLSKFTLMLGFSPSTPFSNISSPWRMLDDGAFHLSRVLADHDERMEWISQTLPDK